MAEGVGFEPTEPFGSPVFKTGAIDHSTTPPVHCVGQGYAQAWDRIQEKLSPVEFRLDGPRSFDAWLGQNESKFVPFNHSQAVSESIRESALFDFLIVILTQ
jgi:hypothetical protein